MNAIIIDDEPKAIELLKNYLQHFNSIKLVNTFRTGMKALEYLSNNNVDIIFLDINMPHLSGISLSKIINRKTKIIFTTAYPEYAVESYEINAVDYLLKPISFERFTKAVNKALSNLPELQTEREDKFLIKSGYEIHNIKVEEILYLKKDGNYIIYVLENKKIIARESTSEALSRLPEQFLQVHKSYIINTNRVDVIHRDEVKINNISITVGASFNEQFKKRFKM
jgi:two-component system LytT family response regulator